MDENLMLLFSTDGGDEYLLFTANELKEKQIFFANINISLKWINTRLDIVAHVALHNNHSLVQGERHVPSTWNVTCSRSQWLPGNNIARYVWRKIKGMLQNLDCYFESIKFAIMTWLKQCHR